MSSELTEFLTHRRGRISPETVGLSRSKSRRTRGLTREDMAELAGVSFKWYTLFESGASKGVSRKLAERVAVVLALGPAERHYLLGLLGFSDGPMASPPMETALLTRLMHQMDTVAAALYSPVLEVIDCNVHFSALFPPPDPRSRFGRNTLWRLFFDRPYRAAWVDWPAVARRTVSDFRIVTAYMRHTLDYAALRLELDEHEDFLEVWNSAEAFPVAAAGGPHGLVTPSGRRVALESLLLRSMSAPGLHLGTLTIVDGLA